MSILTRFFGTKYNDAQLMAQGLSALEEDPLLPNGATLIVSSEQGVVKISGTVHKNSERDRAEGVVRSAIRNVGLKFDRIENDVRVEEALV